MRDAARVLGCRNEAEYLRRLHMAVLRLYPSLAGKPKSRGARA
jgi:hypothetical protein